jgi:oligoendopeptidase F
LVAQAEVVTRDQIPVAETWDLSSVYVDGDAWEADGNAAKTALERAVAFRGKLGESAESLKGGIEAMLAVHRILERYIVYAALEKDIDTADSVALARFEKASNLSVEAGQALAFIQPEVMAIDPAALDGYLADPVLADYRHLLEEMVRLRPYTRSIEVEEVLAQGADVARIARDAFNALDNVDLDFGTVKDEQGNDIALTKGRYQLLIESKDRAVRKGAYDALLGEYSAHKHTLAQLHAGSVRKDVFSSKVRGYDSARQAALFGDAIPESVYDSLIAAVRDSRQSIVNYLDLRRRVLGLDDLAIYDLYVPLSALPERHYGIQEAVEIVLAALAPLGERYVADLREGFASRWVDWHESKGKRSGAYSWGVYGEPPVILMNWNGTLDHVFTLAHEAGHAMHSFYADRAQPFHEASYSLFTAEIASTVNEVLLTWHLLGLTPEDDAATRFSILNRFADTIQGTLLRQTMFAEFEHRTHTDAEASVPLTLERLNEIYGQLTDFHLPGVLNDDHAKLVWSRVPHFYRAFYVFQYATGISAAVALATAIRDEGAPAVDRYLGMLRAGGSDYSLPLLQRAGVDLTTPEPVKAALAEFDRTVQTMEALIDRGALNV